MAEGKVNIHKDHRKKVKDRFFECGFTGMPDHNVLEAILFLGIPQKDTNPIAHELIDTFGSFSGVLEAKKSDLLKIKGMTESAAFAIMSYLPVNRRYIESLQKKKPVFETNDEIIEFLRPLFFEKSTIERVFVLCFDSKNRMIACRNICDGDISSALFDVRELTRVVLEVNAQKIIVAHSHPHGVALPSREDISTTKLIYEMMKFIKVHLDDHLIVTDTGYMSMAKSRHYTHIFHGLGPINFDE